MIIVIIIGVGDTGENGTVPAIVPFSVQNRWGKCLERSAHVSHVSRATFHMGISGIVFHKLRESSPQAPECYKISHANMKIIGLCVGAGNPGKTGFFGSEDSAQDIVLKSSEPLPETLKNLSGTQLPRNKKSQAEGLAFLWKVSRYHRDAPPSMFRILSMLFLKYGSSMLASIFRQECITVVWSRPPNSDPISG